MNPPRVCVPRLLLATSVVLVLVAATAVQARADEVVLVPGSTIKGAAGGRVRGEIQSESPAEVVVKLGQTQINIPIDQIVSVRYAAQPASMTLAESREAGGLLSEAAELYKKAAGEAAERPLIQQAARYKQARLTAELALADPSRNAEAVALLETFRKTYPAGRQTGAALEALARLLLQKGDFKQVDPIVAALAKLPRGADRAAVLRARVLARKGDHAAAESELARLIKSAPKGSSLQREAQLAHAESLAALKKFAEAEAELQALIQATDPEDAAAQSVAHNTLGDCLRAAGRSKDALGQYLYTDLVYSKDKEQHPRALAQISRLWRELKQDERADEAWKRLKQDYPQSPWLTASPTP